MKPQNFFVVTLTAFFSSLILWFVFFDLQITKESIVSHSFKHTLLKETSGPRIIIESGSNSHFSINSALLEKHFNRKTIVAADNGSYPLRLKLLRLAKYANKGDVVLLPLEWSYYTENSIKKNFSQGVFHELNFYYHSLPLYEKIKFAFQVPFSITLSNFIKNKIAGSNVNNDITNIFNFRQRYLAEDRGGYDFKDQLPFVIDFVKQVNCEQYIFTHFIGNGFKISDTFFNNIKLVKKLEEKGVKVIFTWPAVVGDSCYSGQYSEAFFAFFQQVGSVLKEHNLTHVGEFTDSYFDSSMMWDTYYHVNEQARDLRTFALIEALSSVIPVNDSSVDVQADFLQHQYVKAMELLPPLPKNTYIAANTAAFFSKVVLAKGWSVPEPFGVWSHGSESELVFKLVKNQNYEKIVVESHLFHTEDKTRVYINNQFIGSYLIKGITEINLPPIKIDDTGLVTIKFEYSNVTSPYMLGLSNDIRLLKLGLVGFTLK